MTKMSHPASLFAVFAVLFALGVEIDLLMFPINDLRTFAVDVDESSLL